MICPMCNGIVHQDWCRLQDLREIPYINDFKYAKRVRENYVIKMDSATDYDFKTLKEEIHTEFTLKWYGYFNMVLAMGMLTQKPTNRDRLIRVPKVSLCVVPKRQFVTVAEQENWNIATHNPKVLGAILQHKVLEFKSYGVVISNYYFDFMRKVNIDRTWHDGCIKYHETGQTYELDFNRILSVMRYAIWRWGFGEWENNKIMDTVTPQSIKDFVTTLDWY
jgi:hypothetical protein